MTKPWTTHPAKFSSEVLAAIGDLGAKYLAEGAMVLDPFAGTGLIHTFHPQWQTVGVEIEPEGAIMHPRNIQGDATHLPFRDGSFFATVTSPCMKQSELMLTADLRWVSCGDVEVGDEVMAFEEEPYRVKGNGQPARRRWQKAVVVRSEAKRATCVRVILSTGEEIITTPEHPWLANRYEHSTERSLWVPSSHLMDTAPFVLRQMEPWKERTSFDAGWLSGMFDGEGSLSLGGHGAPKMTLCQALGPVTDRAASLMTEFGYKPNSIERKGLPEHRKPIQNLYVTGGMTGLMRALGELRPMRLLSKWADLDIGTRSIQPEKVRVLRVEDAGVRDIQEIETTTGTYIGAGFLMHNCYGNRMADHHNAKEKCRACKGTGHNMMLRMSCPKCNGEGRRHYRRNTYRHSLPEDRPLHENSAAAMQWGEAYRDLHRAAWSEVSRVTTDFVFLNISDHIRKKAVVPVTDWHVEALGEVGFHEIERKPIKTKRNGFGANRDARVENEWVVVLGR